MNDLQTNWQKSISGCSLVPLLIVALGVAGCRSVSVPAPQNDASLTQAVQSKIASDSSLASEAIHVAVQGGVATLNGTASSDAARSLAASDTAQVPGIRIVVNNLTVTSTASAATNNPTPRPQATPPPVLNTPRVVTTPKRVKPAPEIIQTAPPNAAPAPEQAESSPPAPIERVTPSQPPQPAAAPERRSFTIPADTTLPVRMSQTLDSATSQEGDTFAAVLDSDILVDGSVVLRMGTAVTGHVDTVHEAAHFKGNSLLIIQLTSLQDHGTRTAISTDAYSKAGDGRGKNSAEKIGGGAAVGAILGGIFGGGKGAAIGAAAGGGAGAGAQAITRGQQVQIPAESLVRFRLTSPVEVRVSGLPERSSEPVLQRNN